LKGRRINAWMSWHKALIDEEMGRKTVLQLFLLGPEDVRAGTISVLIDEAAGGPRRKLRDSVILVLEAFEKSLQIDYPSTGNSRASGQSEWDTMVDVWGEISRSFKSVPLEGWTSRSSPSAASTTLPAVDVGNACRHLVCQLPK
jgi:hypothetical protein